MRLRPLVLALALLGAPGFTAAPGGSVGPVKRVAPVPGRVGLSPDEKRALQDEVILCWNLGALPTDAMNTTVVVLVDMAPDGRPTGISLQSSDGPNPEATNIAFDAARRAVLRCGASGYPLPADKYEQWREIEMTFNPGNMRIR